MSKTSESLARRAVVAVVLFVGYYLLALVISGVLLFIPYAEWKYTGRIHFRLVFFCVIGAGAILWAVMPRIDRFKAPGPLLLAGQNPELFKEITAAARKLGQQMPVEVYLVPEVNAWVAERGGLMGIRSRRVMGLGAPLLQILSVTELKGILAHEFGHYYGGDTKLGPWIYKTRSNIERTLQGLSRHSGFLQKPFVAYGNLFLRVTHGISRREEFRADELAAGYAGREPMMSALRKLFTSSSAFEPYWDQELAPPIDAGFLPPYSSGFRSYLEADAVKGSLSDLLAEELESGVTDTYATHPALKDRLKALEALGGDSAPDDSAPAASLVPSLPELELELINERLGAKLRSISWENVARSVYPPRWAKLAEKQQANLSGLTLRTLPERLGDFDEFSGNVVRTAGDALYENRKSYAALVVAAAAATKLIEAGWDVRSAPGAAVTLHLGDTSWDPFNEINHLFFGKLTPEQWQDKCERLGIADLALA